MISFSGALVLFTVILTPLYLLTLMLSCRKRSIPQIYGTGATLMSSFMALIAFLTLLSVSAILFSAPEFKASPIYISALPLTVALILCTLKIAGDRTAQGNTRLLTLLLLLHMLIIYTSPYGVGVGERHPALARVAIEGHYDPAWRLLHPVYDPLPMDIGLGLILCDVIGLSPAVKAVQVLLVPLSMIIATDLVLYSLLRRLTSSWVVGVLAVLIFAITPPLNFVEHYCKFTGMMLVLISLFALIMAFKGKLSWQAVTTSILAYVAAIFCHPTAGLGMFVILGLLLGGFLFKRFSSEARMMFESSLLRVGLTLLMVITFARWIYGGGFQFLIPKITQYVQAMLQWREEELTGYMPLYERAGINPIQAYPWSTPVAMATALILYTILKKRPGREVLISSLAIGGLIFLIIGFSGAHLRGGGIGAAMYPGFGILMPAASLTAFKLLRSSHRLSAALVISLVVASSAIALNDPMISPKGWQSIMRTTSSPGGEESHYVLASNLLSLVPANTSMRVATEVALWASFLNPYARIEGFVYEPLDPKYQRDLPILSEGKLEPRTLYLLRSSQVLPFVSDGRLSGALVNFVFDTKSYKGFCGVEG